MSKNEEVDFLDNDVLAVMNKNGVKITFIVCDNDALGPEPYKLLLWDESAVLDEEDGPGINGFLIDF